jgi:hypothetical protein
MNSSEKAKGISIGVACARIFWMMIGPITLAVLAFNIANTGRGWLIGLDIAYLLVLTAVLAARWLEFRSGQGQTAEGLPLTAGGLRRYLLITASVGLVVWVGANFIGNVWLER